MSDYTGDGDAAIVTAATLPDDDTEIDAADVNVPFEVLINLAAWIKKRLGVDATSKVVLGAGARVPAGTTIDLPNLASLKIDPPAGLLTVRVRGHFWFDQDLEWIHETSGAIRQDLDETELGSASAADVRALYLLDGLPHNTEIRQVYVFVKGGAGHTDPPANYPAVTLRILDITTGTTTSFGPASDIAPPTQSLPEYQAVHGILIEGVNTVFDAQKHRAVIEITGEYGTHCKPGFTVYGAQVFLQMKEMPS